MNSTKNLIEDKLYMNPTKNLIEDKLYMNPRFYQVFSGVHVMFKSNIVLWKISLLVNTIFQSL
jgi:hypothetical protein